MIDGMAVGEVRPGYELWRPNRERSGSATAKFVIVFLLLATAALAALITIAGWPLLKGGGAMGVVCIIYAVLYALFGLYYYLRIANVMFMLEAMEPGRLPVSLGMRTALGVTALATIVIGVFPEPFIHAVNWSLNLVQAPHVSAVMR